ncbi:glycosyltransferase family 4 protein [Ectothiorhodospira haloalkaliphila]|uniref:glycosyltransferase family 4 protein n=1 Tax=Ectothiorhodospira haloalkaliphila TaxID=421628 RepID=UPI001EE7DEFD|nr:glycosyltransferase family 4 protein [Ectothiorhodospira haloalkaliphila]MCG5526263.1 glycosyltransferase family 4 protein [Ectothiorhodospira haloalkaliphila]
MPWMVPAPTPPQWANVVHVNSWLHTRFIPPSLPLVVTLHGCTHDPVFEPYKSTLQRWYHRLWIKRLELATIRRANTTTAVSHYTTRQAAITFSHQNIIPIHNWIDTSAFYPNHREKPDSPFRLLFVGSLSTRKGADLLPEIMNRLGDGFELRYTGDYKMFKDSILLPKNMFSLGHLNGTRELVAAYHKCDALLFPSRLEGFGLVAAEAMACGRPVIASNSTALPEVVIDGETGFLCPTNDIGAFVEAIRSLRDNPNRWQIMRYNSIHYTRTKFSEETQVQQYLDIYRDVAGCN